MAEAVMLTAVGVAQARPTCYELGGERATADFASIALLQLLKGVVKLDRVLAVVTPSAKSMHWERIASACAEHHVRVDSLDIPDGNNDLETREILHTICEAVPLGCLLILDITHGLRSIPFLFYAAALYLTSARNVRLMGAYYGRYDCPGEVKPMIDLKPILELPRWFQAVEEFKRTGNGRLLAGLFESLAPSAPGEEGPQESYKAISSIKKISEALRESSFAYDAGLPLELGRSAFYMSEKVKSLPTEVVEKLPLAAELCEYMTDSNKSWSIPTGTKGHWKSQIKMTSQELERQRHLIMSYFERGQAQAGLGLLREYMVSFFIERGGQAKPWLGKSQRKSTEDQLNSLRELLRRQVPMEPTLDRLARCWDLLTSCRNLLHHHGMDESAIFEGDIARKIDQIRASWDDIERNAPQSPIFPGSGGKLLICPVGLSPGVLYSALLAAEPQRALILTSREAQPRIAEACQQAVFQGSRLEVVIADPHSGFGEISQILRRDDVVESLILAENVMGCITGGTTLFGHGVERLCEKAARFGRPVRRFALVDRRPIEAQRAQPYVRGESIDLDDHESAEA